MARRRRSSSASGSCFQTLYRIFLHAQVIKRFGELLRDKSRLAQVTREGARARAGGEGRERERRGESERGGASESEGRERKEKERSERETRSK